MPDLPTLTQRIDDYFLTTWFEIRPEAIDNILESTVIWAALRNMGSWTSQVGGDFITRTIRFGTQQAKAVSKGDVFSQGEPELETMARWEWKYLSAHVQRSVFDDQKNNGPAKIKSLVGQRLRAARESMEQHYEEKLMRTANLTEDAADKDIQGINDIVPPFGDRNTGTYGGISRSNAYWSPKYRELTAAPEVNLLSDMKVLYNDIFNNQAAPNLILSARNLFELYEEFALDISQIIKDEGTRLADLGFEVLRFKGKPMVWSPNVTESNLLMLNTEFIEIVYDPELWFSMTPWKTIPLQGERIAHILSAVNLVSSQLRRHGRLYAS